MSNLDESFTDNPPEGFAPFSQKTLLLLKRAMARVGIELESEVEFIGAYKLISDGHYSPDMDDMVDAYAKMPDADVDAITN